MAKKPYCESCNGYVDYNVKDTIIHEKIKDVDVAYKGTVVTCKECNSEVYVAQYDDINTKLANEEYRKIIGIITVDEIKAMMEKYNIGATVLSIILGWGEVTISRYLKGQIPSKRYSDILYKLINNPYEMKKLIEENKNLMNEIAYKKCDEALRNFVSEEAISTTNNVSIEQIVNYILVKKSVTPKALQKILYYIQGFSKAFNGDFIFYDEPKAWMHGPVYEQIYHKYKEYGYNPITNIENSNENNKICEKDRILIDNVVKFYGCFTGDTLEAITHIEMPWLHARGGLLENQPSSKPINLDSISEYFTGVKNKYNMIGYHDVKSYVNDMLERID